MSRSETNSSRRGFQKSLFIGVAAVILLLGVYLGYTMLSSRANPCESIFKQTAIRVQNNIESIKKKGNDLIDTAQIQRLSKDSRQAALCLKTCCILFHEERISFDEFVQCQDDFKNYEMAIGRLTELIGAIQQAKQQEKAQLLSYKLERIDQTLNGLGQSSRHLQERISRYAHHSQAAELLPGSPPVSFLTEVEPNDAYRQANRITMGTIGAELFDRQDTDFFKFDVPSGHILTLDFIAGEAGQPMKVSLRNADRQEIWSADHVVPGVTKSTQVILNTAAGGMFFLVVSDGIGHYHALLSARSQDDAGSGNDAGDKISKAIEIELGSSYLGELGGVDVQDWYQFDIAPGHILNLVFTPDPEAQVMNFSLRNFERNEIWYSDEVTPGVTRSKRMIMNSLSGGRYYLAAYGGQGSYSFEIAAESQNDAGSGNDAGDSITRSVEIAPGYSYNGELGGLDEEDWYQIRLLNGDILEFAFTPSPEGKPMKFLLFNYGRQEVWHSGEITPGVTKSDRLLMNSTSGGIYFIRAFHGSGTYQIDLYTKSQDDAGSGADAGDKITRAIEINSGDSAPGELGALDLEDWYKFDPKRGEKLSFTCDPASESMKMALHTLDRRAIGYSAEILPGVTKSFEIPEDVKPPYFIRIFEGRGRYRIQLN